jgi:hypothetical protein
MSRERNIAKTRPGFGKRGSVRVKQIVRAPASGGRLTQMFVRWWGKKDPPKRPAPKGLGARR